MVIYLKLSNPKRGYLKLSNPKRGYLNTYIYYVIPLGACPRVRRLPTQRCQCSAGRGAGGPPATSKGLPKRKGCERVFSP